ncbi:uncharacterized protein LOC131858395 [Cryptomeria japonica]|uniref:uncharacterized protein LOC131858395 n=1 Tax=Cryptomeria japonica TaxID=3369 RepID=UPI0027DA25DE|nr:uncharacterized protein LOC131858395 [Cryptomeria japonica]
MGDFNALLDLDEKMGGLRMSNKVMEDFREFVQINKLIDVVPKNGLFTWTNRRAGFAHISERLDRHCIGEFWSNSAMQIEVFIHPISLSDHFPVELKLSEAKPRGKSCFRFQSMWWRDPEFGTHLEGWWKESDIYSGTLSFTIELELNSINSITIAHGMSSDTYFKEEALKAKLAELLLREELYWRDKARELWIKEGDSNTKFFHATMKAKSSRNLICSILDEEGVRHSLPEDVEKEAVNYFSKILGEVDGSNLL